MGFWIVGGMIVCSYVIALVLSLVVIGVFTFAGIIASNAEFAITQFSLVLAFFIALTTELYNLKRPVLRVKISLFAKEEVLNRVFFF
jgi:hypothetical protein